MENITLQNIAVILGFIVGIGGSIGTILLFFKKRIIEIVNSVMKPYQEELTNTLNNINKSINNMNETIGELGINDCKNFLTIELARIEAGEEISIEEKQWIHHNYQRYTGVYNQNSYVHDKFEKLRKEGKI